MSTPPASPPTEPSLADERSALLQDLTDRLLENLIEAVVVCDRSGRLIYFNQAAKLWHGLDISLLPPEEWAAHYDLFQGDGKTPLVRAFAGEVVTGVTMSIVARGQAPRFVQASATPLRDADGTILGAVAVMHDVTEQRLAQVQIERSADKLNEAQRLAHVGSWELDLVSGELSWSDEIFRLFEIDKSKFSATYEGFLGAIHSEDRDAVNQAYSQSLADRLPYEITHRLLMPDGRIKWVHERCTSDFDVEGKPLRSIGTVQDITPQRQAELALEQLNLELEERVESRTAELKTARDEAERASQAKSDFLSRMSHELRTPMNAILGFGQLLESDEDDPLTDIQKENVQEMLRAGRHLLALINEMLDLAQVESGRIDMSPEPVEVPPLIQDCLGLVRALAQQRGITLHLGAPAPCVARADRLRLRQVLLNLLSNAIKYNRDAGRVDIHCGPGQPGQVRIEVRDTGKGIAPENLARLFKPFERLESAYQGIEGTGIGLALTRRLVEAMDGQVGVSSVPGAGSTFWVELPSALEAAAQALAAPAQVASSTAEVIYIEDNPLNLRVMQQLFAMRPQWTLHAAHSAEEGIDLARAHAPALILMDINLPGMDGYQALAVLRADAATAHIPVLAVSANAMLGDRERGLQAGFVDYATKPLDVPSFLQMLDRLLGGQPGGTHRMGGTRA